ncbi:MAG: dTDP-4-dehydrorhamnose 3,5-epimerase family protein [Pseudomonadota bacterium]
MSLTVAPGSLEGLFTLRRTVRTDPRGSFARLYEADTLREHCGIEKPVVHINRSVTSGPGTVRGLHFQLPPYEEIKIVTCLSGTVFDVAVDIRPGSPTYLRHQAVELSGDEPVAFVIGEGFAHGFQVLSDCAELLYLHTAGYAPDAEGRLNVADPRIGISWPLPVSGLSDQDRSAAMLADDAGPGSAET